ncbi:TPA: winged helix-turn-helix domain-containing protein [Stenotrophomonas maltophilia]|nr:winged helix-turn-helix domain-containing protein [Stenotrophomonas maltophilia]HEL3778897.1 winged helix-turn-helix domain-containing protein [Stenotrophomonas maltophilia]HEL5004373.1 winged helix-turn-helix domain-containing protein [Stenotrophomonas maltophilia]
MDTLRLLDLDIDRPAQRVSRAGQVLPVSGLSWTLLDVLLAHGAEVVDFDTLAAQVWAPAVVGEDAVSQRVKLLRQALGDDSRRPRYIRSVRGRGYQLCAQPLPGTAQPARSHWRGRAGWGLMAAVVLGVAATLVWWPRPTAPGAAQTALQRADYYAGIGQASNNERAISLYRQALQVDPESAPARRGLSRALAAQGCLFNGSPAQVKEALALASEERRRAPRDAAAHALWGYAQDCLGDMPQAMAGYARALELDPADERSRASLAYLRQERGQLVTALRENLSLKAPERVRFRDVQVARELELLGFTQAAAQRHARNFQLYPDNVFSNIAWPRSLYLAGTPQQARQALDEALARGTPHPQLLRLYGAQPAQAAWIGQRLQQLDASAGDGWSDTAVERALLLQAAGRTDAAVAALHQAVDDGFRDVAWLRATPLLVPLHGAPGWPALLQRIDTDITRQRAQVLAAAWRPEDLAALSAAPAAGTR